MRQLCYNAGMATITLEVPDELALRLQSVGANLPNFLNYALDLAGISRNSVLREVSSPWNEALEFLAGAPAPDEIIAYKMSEEAQDRLEELLDLNREGSLTPQEEDELDAFLQIDHLFIMLKAHVR